MSKFLLRDSPCRHKFIWSPLNHSLLRGYYTQAYYTFPPQKSYLSLKVICPTKIIPPSSIKNVKKVCLKQPKLLIEAVTYLLFWPQSLSFNSSYSTQQVNFLFFLCPENKTQLWLSILPLYVTHGYLTSKYGNSETTILEYERQYSVKEEKSKVTVIIITDPIENLETTTKGFH